MVRKLSKRDHRDPTKIMVAMPAYNEEKYVGSLVLLARQHADDVLVVDDGSTDRTSEVARLAGAVVVEHGGNKGYGAAVQTIFSEAKRRAPDILVLLDADAQHDPGEIVVLAKAIMEGYDVVIGSRRLPKTGIPAYRKVGQRILSYLTRVLSGSKIADTESGYRAFSRRAIDLLEPRERGMAVSAETVSQASQKGLRITEVPVSIIYTKNGSTLNPIEHGLGLLNRILVMISERRPLLFFGVAGAISIVLGVTAGVMVLRILFASHVLHTGTALVSIMLITVGVLCIFTGIILNVLVKRIEDSLRPRIRAEE
jgi:glycosyltransferase involved in cell wall biosynthesis